MADTYFDPSNGADRALLHEDVRSHSALYDVAGQAENEVIRVYTDYDSDGEVDEVRLAGYDSDPALAGSALKDAIRRTIAEVVSWRLLHYDDDERAQSVSQGRRSVTYKDGGPSRFWPKDWSRRLAGFDTTGPLYHI